MTSRPLRFKTLRDLLMITKMTKMELTNELKSMEQRMEASLEERRKKLQKYREEMDTFKKKRRLM